MSAESGFSELGAPVSFARHGRRKPQSSAPSLRSTERGELLLKFSQLGQIVVDDIGVVGMERQEILVIPLGGVKSLERDNLGHNPPSEDLGVI